MPKKHLSVVPAPAPDPDPTDEAPAHLGEPGRRLWRSIMEQYAVEDAGGRAMLEAACAALDRAERCREIINADGEVVRTKMGPKPHPLLTAETQARALSVRTLARLGLDLEPLHDRPGRPGGSR